MANYTKKRCIICGGGFRSILLEVVWRGVHEYEYKKRDPPPKNREFFVRKTLGKEGDWVLKQRSPSGPKANVTPTPQSQ